MTGIRRNKTMHIVVSEGLLSEMLSAFQ